MNLLLGDCLEQLKNLPDNSVDSVVTDPPYGLGKEPDVAEVMRAWAAGEVYKPKGKGFMGKEWDAFVPGPEVWREVYRVLKPGGHVLSFFGTRTYDWGVMAMRFAGFECRDMCQWLYGQGFPKSLDISKAIDKAAGAEREVTGVSRGHVDSAGAFDDDNYQWKPEYERKDKPVTDLAKKWNGWGTALKPANEPIVLARKPLEGTVAKNVEKFGVGGLNIDAGRVEFAKGESTESINKGATKMGGCFGNGAAVVQKENPGRFPSNVLLDEEAAKLLDEQTQHLHGAGSPRGKGRAKQTNDGGLFGVGNHEGNGVRFGDSGGASRFFKVIPSLKYDSNAACVQSAEIQQNLEELSVLEAARELLLLKQEGRSLNNNSSAKTAAKSSCDTREISRAKNNSAQENAMPLLDLASLYLNASDAENQTGYIETSIARSLASRLVSLANQSKACLVFTASHRELIPVLNHALSAALLENIDTITTIQNQQRLSGFASLVTAGIITWAKSAQNCESGPTRFVYQAKASKSERNAGLDGMPLKNCGMMEDDNYPIKTGSGNLRDTKRQNFHPTVKPIKLMQYLITLITPPSGVVLDPFMGSGTTGCAAVEKDFDFIGIERDPEYFEIAKKRIEFWQEVAPQLEVKEA